MVAVLLIPVAVIVPVTMLVHPSFDPVVLVALGVLVSVVGYVLWSRQVGRLSRRTSPGRGQDVP
jgi:membrane protein implicated in regulation of membrane protease activity